MTEKLLKATHAGNIKIGEHEISCAVLENGTRILVERSMATALGKKGGGSYWEKKKQGEKSALLPEYIALKSLQPYINADLQNKFDNPIRYIDKLNKVRTGVEATILADICDVWITAREKNALTGKQIETAKRAYILMRGFANVGITALVDEATGYQEVRDRNALEKILEKYIGKTLGAWAKTFPDEFYQEIFRLRGWEWRGMKINRPSYVGIITRDIIYERLAPGVIKALEDKNPWVPHKGRKNKHHQWLTGDFGNPTLKNHLIGVIALMRASSSWPAFERSLARAYPRQGDQPELPNMPE